MKGSDSMSPTVPPISQIRKSRSGRVGADELLDRVGDVRDDLDGGAEIVAAPLRWMICLIDPAEVTLSLWRPGTPVKRS
jgi:hypothetical protein